MPEVLLWIAAVFAVLGVPPLVIVLVCWRRERRGTRAKAGERHRLARMVWPIVVGLAA